MRRRPLNPSRAVTDSPSVLQTLERDQLRRLQTLQPELEFASSIREKDAACVPVLDDGENRMKSKWAELFFPPSGFSPAGPPSPAQSRSKCRSCTPRLQTSRRQKRQRNEARTPPPPCARRPGARATASAVQVRYIQAWRCRWKCVCTIRAGGHLPPFHPSYARRLLAGLSSPSPTAFRLTAIDNLGPPAAASAAAPAAVVAGEKLRTGAKPALRDDGSGVPLISRGEPDGKGSERIGMSANTGWALPLEPGVTERPPLRDVEGGATTGLPLPLMFFSILEMPPRVLSCIGAEL